MEVVPVIGTSIWAIVKVMFLVAIFVYVVFAYVIVRQTKLMTNTLEVGFEIPIRLMAWFHLLFAVGTFILAILIL